MKGKIIIEFERVITSNNFSFMTYYNISCKPGEKLSSIELKIN